MATRTLHDDLGEPVRLAGAPQRVVSLVPSLTEALARTVPDRLVGATDWCTHPPGLILPRVRGTKNPDRVAIAALTPDLVVANREENRRLDVDRLRSAGLCVWVTVVENLEQAYTSLHQLFVDVLQVPRPTWLGQAEAEWAAPPSDLRRSVVVPVWRDPWMVVGPATFSGDVVARLGLQNVYAGNGERYPRVTLSDLRATRPDLVLLPDEPYPFGPADGPECFPDSSVVLVSGRDLTWYGPSLVDARARLAGAIAAGI